MNNKLYRIITLIMVLPMTMIFADEKDFDEKHNAIAKSMDLTDRAAGIHNASNISLFFENYGKFSHDSFLYGDAGEFPANSNHNYLYLMSAMVGVAPDAASGRSANVIQSRYATSTDWMPVGGYHQGPATDIAFSDNTATWPNAEWFFQDDEGEALIVSTQDSYCVYNDAGNQNEVLGIQIAQTGYAFGVSDFEDMIFFTFEVTNQSDVSYDSVYFGLYHDFDIGNDPYGVNDYSDDMLGFDAANNFIKVSDADQSSLEWNGEPGMMGIVLLETPQLNGNMAGITDMHYGIFEDNDETQMALLSSNLDYLPDGIDPRNFFNTGDSPDAHFDGVSAIPSTGKDIFGTISSGPFDLSPTDSLTFIIGIIAGIDEADLYNNLYAAQGLYANEFVAPKPPTSPALSGVAGHNGITLYWTNSTEGEIDDASGIPDFEGYRLYKSVDNGLSWDQIDRNSYPESTPEAVPFASFDRVNGWGDDTGLQYTYVDDSVINGFEYWYSITAFDHGDALTGSLESPIGNSVDVSNTISIIPASTPAGYESGDISDLNHYDGNANYTLSVDPLAPEQLNNFSYDLHFLYALQNEIGNPGIWATVDITDSSLVPTIHFGIEFTAEDQINILNLDTRTLYWAGDLILGVPYPFESYFTLTFHRSDTLNIPSPGDLLSINFSTELLRYDGQDTLQVLGPQRFDPGADLVSDDGLILSLDAQPVIQNISVPPILDFELEIEVADLESIQDMDFQITITQSGHDTEGNTYIILRTTDENSIEIGVADTLYNGWGIQYNGWAAWFGFDPAHPPAPGTSATFSTLPPIRPTIQDYYQFGIIDAKTNPDMLVKDMSEIRVVPNPYMAGSLWETERGSFVREPVRQIQFTNLPAECEIHIFTLSGDLIKTLEHDAGHGTEAWDLRAEGGREIVSGIYLYQVKSAGFEYLNRFAVIK
ncbi:MAG: hypothetical protein HOB84_10135 [Candidatus Marinimicrobia bacterium]|jgi:hypothetical protein|nr:hypothetical protein [Candidatus Neomarinimicrobiota bacterium]MBT4360932.1 hypothetical protein [Candidatus Neomarinimicrobiota bacterium]MBT4715120.1 hypothetical protein [Candidatus Neomarinimicrobiota bacterium]MBT4946187.1 hypothetical protein [Candidatus Neomarinimicrobiota bacterium]MBT5271140.1 hypothetical protein [Candidatus Neomarinimicrobiota bacterium]